MVDLGEIQAAYYMVAATGVLVAAAYYVMNMRYTMKAREMEMFRTFSQEFVSKEGMTRYAIVMAMEWKDHEDFMNKYGYSNPEMLGNWSSQFFAFEQWGILIKSKTIKPELIYELGGYGAIRCWEKFKDVIQGARALY